MLGHQPPLIATRCRPATRRLRLNRSSHGTLQWMWHLQVEPDPQSWPVGAPRQRPRPDAEISYGGEVSWCPPKNRLKPACWCACLTDFESKNGRQPVAQTLPLKSMGIRHVLLAAQT